MNNENTLIKDYYSLIEIYDLKLSPLQKRALSTRFNKLLKNGTLILGQNLFRSGSSWQIHHSLIPLFNYHSVLTLKQIYPVQ